MAADSINNTAIRAAINAAINAAIKAAKNAAFKTAIKAAKTPQIHCGVNLKNANQRALFQI